MMGIRRLFFCLLVLLTFSCEKIERPRYSNELGRFVRFNLQVDNDGVVIPGGTVDPSAHLAADFYQSTVQTLAIPVSITSEPLEDVVKVWFSYDTTGTYSDFSVSPESGELTFNGSQLTDTIYLDYRSRWNAADTNRFVFQLDGVSDTTIHLGNLNSLEPNTTLTVTLEELFLRYNFPTENTFEILGEVGETVEFDVEFPDGFFPPEIADIDLVIEGFREFDYTLEQLPYDDDDTRVTYRFTLNETLDDDLVTYRVTFELAELPDYHLSGYNTFSITKPENVPRDVALNTAGHFYDLGDQFYRTYGELWIDYLDRDSCVWRSFSQFTYPVEVPQDHPNAVLFSDQGTLDPSDDIYHHAFRIGFYSPNAGRTTNSLSLKSWFTNEYTDEDKSPGFNLRQGLEFYPDNNGTSANGGIVKVIPQDIILSGKKGDGSLSTHTISIEGEGEYILLSEGVYELSFELRLTNQELFGGTQSAQYLLYNTDEYEEPLPLDTHCLEERVL